jgi:hypothetical protein
MRLKPQKLPTRLHEEPFRRPSCALRPSRRLLDLRSEAEFVSTLRADTPKLLRPMCPTRRTIGHELTPVFRTEATS